MCIYIYIYIGGERERERETRLHLWSRPSTVCAHAITHSLLRMLCLCSGKMIVCTQIICQRLEEIASSGSTHDSKEFTVCSW